MATQKAKRAAKIKLENPSKPMGQVMLEAGYAPSVAVKPKHLTESKGWQELMEDYLPDKHLVNKHREFLDSPRLIRKWAKGELEYETEETSPESVKALEMAYKLKNRYKDLNVGQVLVLNLSESAVKKYAANRGTGKDIERHA